MKLTWSCDRGLWWWGQWLTGSSACALSWLLPLLRLIVTDWAVCLWHSQTLTCSFDLLLCVTGMLNRSNQSITVWAELINVDGILTFVINLAVNGSVNNIFSLDIHVCPSVHGRVRRQLIVISKNLFFKTYIYEHKLADRFFWYAISSHLVRISCIFLIWSVAWTKHDFC